MEPVCPSFNEKLFGCNYFPFYQDAGSWRVYKVKENAPPATVWHGTTLHQLRLILSDNVWKAGLWVLPSKGNPLAVWLTDSRAMSMDRASIRRGYACSRKDGHVWRTVPDGWDCPCVIGFNLPLEMCGTHAGLPHGRRCRRYRTRGRREVPLEELRPVEVSFHVPTYERYNQLRDHWCDVNSGKKVLCRTRQHHPEDFYCTGHGKPLSCGRVTANPVGDRWLNAVGGTGEWRCPQCNLNAALQVGSITGDL